MTALNTTDAAREFKTIKTLEVDRSRLVKGSLMRTVNGGEAPEAAVTCHCIQGHLAIALGLEPSDLAYQVSLGGVIFSKPWGPALKNHLMSMTALRSDYALSTWLTCLMTVNDSPATFRSSQTIIEKNLKELLKRAGIKLTFTGEYPPSYNYYG